MILFIPVVFTFAVLGDVNSERRFENLKSVQISLILMLNILNVAEVIFFKSKNFFNKFRFVFIKQVNIY